MYKLIICLFACLSTLHAQEKYLSLEDANAIIRNYHPVVRQAKLEVAQADAALQAARGLFDPSFYNTLEQKTFNGTDYFNYNSQTLKIPTWFGVDIKAGLENNTGLRTDPSLTTDKSTYVGISIPVLKGLLFDKRRAAVQQGKLFVRMSQQEQRLMINELLLEASMTYWKWAAAHRVNAVLSKALTVSENRYNLVRKSWLSGDRAAIDTVEAMAQLQAVQVMQSQAGYELQKARLMLGNFMWTPESKPYDLPEEVLPDTSWMAVPVKAYPVPVLDDMLKLALETHPKLMNTQLKGDVLTIEKRAKFQSLLPKFDISYNFLNKGYGLNKTFSQPLFENNYKYGAQFALPLFQREARGDYRLAKLKLQDNLLELDKLKLEIGNKVKAVYAEILAMQQQVLFMQQNTLNQQLLLQAEETKFNLGESSLFLVNARENKLLETEQKYAELRSKFFISLQAIQAAAGTLR
ncbi:MAG: hypothetical protein RLY85_1409 [Bacteroidota bacterium]